MPRDLHGSRYYILWCWIIIGVPVWRFVEIALPRAIAIVYAGGGMRPAFDQPSASRRLSVQEAAGVLGVTVDAV
jgi:hypothetical protein